MWAIIHKLRFFHVLTFAFQRKIHNVKLRQSLLAFFFHLGFQKATNRIQSLHQYSSINVLAVVGLIYLGKSMPTGVPVSFFFITFNMQHAVVSGHNRLIKVNMYEICCKRQTTSQCCWMTSKVYDVGDGTTCRHARFFFNISEEASEFVRTTHGSQTRMITDSYGPVTTCGSHLTSVL